MNVPKSSITLMFEAVRASARLKGVPVTFGARALADQSSPNRLVMVPISATYEAPEDNDNFQDVPVKIEAHIWGESFDHCVYIRDAYSVCLWEYQTSTDEIRVRGGDEEWSADPDTAPQGAALVVSYDIVSFMDKNPLDDSAIVDAARIAPESGTLPTIDLPLP